MPCRSFIVAAWANAWLAGAVSVDDVLDAVRNWPPGGGFVGQHVYAADEQALRVLDTPEAEPLPQALIRLRQAGAVEFALALPAPGDPLGLAGPRRFNEDALEIGEAIVCIGAGLGLIPYAVGAGVQWAASVAHAAAPESLPECDERLARAMATATAALGAHTEQAGWRPSVAVDLPDRRQLATSRLLPPTMVARSDRVVSRAQVCQLVLERVEGDPGLAATARELSAAARRGFVAAVGAAGAHVYPDGR